MLRFVKRTKMIGTPGDPRAISPEKRQPIRIGKTVYILQQYHEGLDLWLDIVTEEETDRQKEARVNWEETQKPHTMGEQAAD